MRKLALFIVVMSYLPLWSYAQETVLIKCSIKFSTFELMKTPLGITFNTQSLSHRIRSNPYIRGSRDVASEGDIFSSEVQAKGNVVTIISEDSSTTTFSLDNGYVKFNSTNKKLEEKMINLIGDRSLYFGSNENCEFNEY